MKKLIVSLVALVAAANVMAMPTRAELSKAEPLVVELMAPTLDEYRSASDKAAAAVKVGDSSFAFAAEAETEAAKFLLLKTAVSYYALGESYDKAADCIASMQASISDLTPDAVAEIVGKAAGKASASKAPRLIAYYRAAQLQIRARNEVSSLEQKLRRGKSEKLQRRYAEALAVSGNWKAAYAAFAKSSDADLARIAAAEAKGTVANEQAAELWWGYKPEFEGSEKFFKAHAVEFYQKALEKGEISGLKKNIVERRIAQVNDVAAATPAAGASSAAAPSQSSAAPEKSGKSIIVKIKSGVELEFVPCPAGTFAMGNGNISNPDKHHYRHEVTITRPFWMSKYPITVEQFGAFCSIDEKFKKENGKQGDPKTPVCLCIGQVDAYCNWLNRRFASALPRNCIFRLPSDAEWEYAFSANSTDKDDPYARYRDGDKTALQEICGKDIPVPVGTAGKPNAWGLYDMLGNGCHYVLDTISSEYWTQTCYGGIKYEHPFKFGYKESETDPLRWYVPQDKGTKARHLMRGGEYLPWSNKGPSLFQRMVEGGSVYRKDDNPDHPRIWTFRVVIGPDLVSEWMAKNGQK